jgi:hypothetical protein
MTLTREHAAEVLATYIKARESQDPDLIVTIFTEDATYHERVLQDPIPNRVAIREYWEAKVVRDQANIGCALLAMYLDGRHGYPVRRRYRRGGVAGGPERAALSRPCPRSRPEPPRP